MKVNFEKLSKSKLGWLMGAVALTISLSSCLNNNDTDTVVVPVAYVSVYNASPDSPGLDVLVDNKQINSRPLEYSNYTGYLQFYTGNRNLKFNSFNASNVLVDTTVTFQANKAYSVFVIDNTAEADALIVEDSAATPAATNSLIRFVNLSPDAASVELTTDSESLFPSKAFKQITAFKEITAQSYTLQAKKDDHSVIVTAPGIVLQPGRAYTIIARGYLNPPSGNTNTFSIQVIDNG